MINNISNFGGDTSPPNAATDLNIGVHSNISGPVVARNEDILKKHFIIDGPKDDDPTWFDMIKEALKNKEEVGLTATQMARIISTNHPRRCHNVKVRTELVQILKNGLAEGLYAKIGSNWVIFDKSLKESRRGRKPGSKRIGRPPKSSYYEDLPDDTDNDVVMNDSIDDVVEARAPVNLEAIRDAEMIKNGWQFNPHTSIHIGLRVKVKSPTGGVASAGNVDAYLPPSLNNGVPLWRITHDNGDMSIVTEENMKLFRQHALGFQRLAGMGINSIICTVSAPTDFVEKCDTTKIPVDCFLDIDQKLFLLGQFQCIQHACDCLQLPIHLVQDSCVNRTRIASKVIFKFNNSPPNIGVCTVGNDVISYLLAEKDFNHKSKDSIKSCDLKSLDVAIGCLSKENKVMHVFKDVETAAAALDIQIAGIKVALNNIGSVDMNYNSFYGLQWNYISGEKLQVWRESDGVPIVVLRAMIAVGSLSWGVIKQDSWNYVEVMDWQRSSAIDCLSLDDVLLWTFSSMHELCVEMEFSDRGLCVLACCQSLLPHYAGLKWRYSKRSESILTNMVTAADISVEETITMQRAAELAREIVQDIFNSPGEDLQSNSYVNTANSSKSNNANSKESAHGKETAAKPIPKIDVPGRSLLKLNLTALQNVMIRKFDPKFNSMTLKEACVVKKIDVSSSTTVQVVETITDDATMEVKSPTLTSNISIANSALIGKSNDEKTEPSVNFEEIISRMKLEGWRFSKLDNELIGARVRRFFPDFIVSDATVIAFLPPEENESVPLWHLRHDDGDTEDADFLPLLKFIHYYNEGLHYDPEDIEKPDEWRSIETTFLHRLEFEDELVESVLAERKVAARKLKEFKYTFPNLAFAALNIIKHYSRRTVISKAEIDVGLNINEIGKHLSNLVGAQTKFTKSLLFVLHKLVSCRMIIKCNAQCARAEVFYTLADEHANTLAGVLGVDTATLLNNQISNPTADVAGDDNWSVDCFAINDAYLFTFKNIKDAADSLGIKKESIHQVCYGVARTTSKLKFRFSTLNSSAPNASESPEDESVRKQKIDMIKIRAGLISDPNSARVNPAKNGSWRNALNFNYNDTGENEYWFSDTITADDTPENDYTNRKFLSSRSGLNASGQPYERKDATIPDMIADDDTHFVVDDTAENKERNLPINSPIPLNFGSGIVIAVDSPYYERYYEKFLQLCLFMSAQQGSILPMALKSSIQQHDEEVDDVVEENDNEEVEEDGDASEQEVDESDVSSYSDHGDAVDDDDESISGVFPTKSGKSTSMAKTIKITSSAVPPGPAMPALKTAPAATPTITSSAMKPVITSSSTVVKPVEGALSSLFSSHAATATTEVQKAASDPRSLLHVCILSNFNHMQICNQLIESGWLVDDSPPSTEATGLANGDIGLNIEVFDGKRILRVKLNRFILSSVDSFHFFLQSNNGDVQITLSKLQINFRELLASQWKVNEIRYFLGGMSSFKGNLNKIQTALKAHTTRSMKEIVLFRQFICRLTGNDHDEKQMSDLHHNDKVKRYLNVVRCGEELSQFTLSTTSGEYSVGMKRKESGTDSNETSNKRCVTHVLLGGSVFMEDGTVRPYEFPPADLAAANSELNGSIIYGSWNCKPVVMIDMATNKILRVFKSGSHAGSVMGCSQSGISQCVRGNRSDYAGYKWAYYKGTDIDFNTRQTVTESAPVTTKPAPPLDPTKKRRGRRTKQEMLEAAQQEAKVKENQKLLQQQRYIQLQQQRNQPSNITTPMHTSIAAKTLNSPSSLQQHPTQATTFQQRPPQPSQQQLQRPQQQQPIQQHPQQQQPPHQLRQQQPPPPQQRQLQQLPQPSQPRLLQPPQQTPQQSQQKQNFLPNSSPTINNQQQQMKPFNQIPMLNNPRPPPQNATSQQRMQHYQQQIQQHSQLTAQQNQMALASQIAQQKPLAQPQPQSSQNPPSQQHQQMQQLQQMHSQMIPKNQLQQQQHKAAGQPQPQSVQQGTFQKLPNQLQQQSHNIAGTSTIQAQPSHSLQQSQPSHSLQLQSQPSHSLQLQSQPSLQQQQQKMQQSVGPQPQSMQLNSLPQQQPLQHQQLQQLVQSNLKSPLPLTTQQPIAINSTPQQALQPMNSSFSVPQQQQRQQQPQQQSLQYNVTHLTSQPSEQQLQIQNLFHLRQQQKQQQSQSQNPITKPN